MGLDSYSLTLKNIIKNIMKIKKLLILFGIVLIVPFVARAAYNDVTLTTDAIISVGGYDLNVSGTTAVVESITVNASDFSFVLLSGSSISVTSSDKKLLSTDADPKYVTSSTCGDSSYTLTHSSNVTGSVTITVTPSSSNACASNTTTSSGSSGSNSGRSGGGGGGTTLPTTPATPSPALPALTSAAPQATFNRGLSVGSTGDEVKNLQTRLLGEGFFKGEVTGYFGPITQKAVKAFQAKYGISQLGIVGPATRAQLNKVFMANERSNAAATSQLTPAQISAIMAQINALLEQVQVLQSKLKALGN